MMGYCRSVSMPWMLTSSKSSSVGKVSKTSCSGTLYRGGQRQVCVDEREHERGVYGIEAVSGGYACELMGDAREREGLYCAA